MTEGQSNRLRTVPMKFQVALGKLQPGRYNCQVTVLDPTGQKAAFWQAPDLAQAQNRLRGLERIPVLVSAAGTARRRHEDRGGPMR